jgi:hypothetical protein
MGVRLDKGLALPASFFLVLSSSQGIPVVWKVFWPVFAEYQQPAQIPGVLIRFPAKFIFIFDSSFSDFL